jgi:hypothetical protein
VQIKVTDSDGAGSNTASVNVNVSNVAPTVAFAASQPTSADEGQTKHYSYTVSDPGVDDFTVAAGFPKCGTDNTASNATTTASGGSFDCTFADGPSTPAVQIQVNDSDTAASNTATANVTVANIKPTIGPFNNTSPGIAGPLVFVPATFSGTFTDPGRIDGMWKAYWTWDGTLDPGPFQQYPNNTTDSHDFANSHQYTSPGCNHTAMVRIVDKDGASDEKSLTIGVGTGAFLPPMTNQPVTNKLKNGQVLPVKIQITNCSGVGQNSLVPAIRLAAGDQTTTPDDVAVAITVPTSASNADTTGVMRSSGSDGSYIYNMNINLPPSALNTDYTVIIYPYGNGQPVGPTLRHVIQATK